MLPGAEGSTHPWTTPTLLGQPESHLLLLSGDGAIPCSALHHHSGGELEALEVGSGMGNEVGLGLECYKINSPLCLLKPQRWCVVFPLAFGWSREGIPQKITLLAVGTDFLGAVLVCVCWRSGVGTFSSTLWGYMGDNKKVQGTSQVPMHTFTPFRGFLHLLVLQQGLLVVRERT